MWWTCFDCPVSAWEIVLLSFYIFKWNFCQKTLLPSLQWLVQGWIHDPGLVNQSTLLLATMIDSGMVLWCNTRPVSHPLKSSWNLQGRSSFLTVFLSSKGFPSGSVVKNPFAVQEMQETQVGSLSQEDPLEKGMVTMVTHGILPW